MCSAPVFVAKLHPSCRKFAPSIAGRSIRDGGWVEYPLWTEWVGGYTAPGWPTSSGLQAACENGDSANTCCFPLFAPNLTV
eukprot:gene18808-biopygen2452